MCAPKYGSYYGPYSSQPIPWYAYASSLRRLASDFDKFCPEAALSLRREAEFLDPVTKPTQRSGREWYMYVDDRNLLSREKPIIGRPIQIKVREVIE